MSNIHLLQAIDGETVLVLGAFLEWSEARSIQNLCIKHNRIIRAHYDLYFHYVITTIGLNLPVVRIGYLDRLKALSTNESLVQSNVSFIKLREYAEGLECVNK